MRRLKIIFGILSFNLTLSIYALNAPNSEEALSAKQLLELLDSYKKHQYPRQKDTKKNLNFEYALDQKVKSWNNRRQKLKELVTARLNAQIQNECIKEGVSYEGYLSGSYGSDFFIKEVQSLDIAKVSREEALIKTLELESMVEQLELYNNVSPYTWNLNPDEVNAIELKLGELPFKVGTERE